MEEYINLKEKTDESQIKKAGEIIKNGGIVIFPTETVYGIGTNAFNNQSVLNLYKIKKRNINKPISLLVSNINMVKQITTNITDLEYMLMKKFFPGPLTLVLRKNKEISDIVTSKKDTVGIRMPNNKIALKLIEYANVPIATTSANISGNPSGKNIQDFINDFQGKVNYIIDNGKSEIGTASTVVQVVDGKIKILREGAIKKEDIENLY